ncbi:MAG: winged helix DNA-binding domain-containing protein [Actinomycetota bacterium]|nr:winged helix DNA-binding domain-containing protein [Actinomycetota bacterium]
MSEPLAIDIATARRGAVRKQALADAARAATHKALMDVTRKIRCVQVDPISAVARTQDIVMFSRLGPRYKPKQLADATFKRKDLFHYWAHAASLVLTDDFPIHNWMMRTWLRRRAAGGGREQQFIRDNQSMQRHILRRLRTEGPLRARDFEVKTGHAWRSSGWTGGQNLGRILEFLWIQGKIAIVGRQGVDRIWGLADEYFPEWTPRERLSEREVVRRSAIISLGALGVATPKQISQHFTRNRYPNLKAILDDLQRSGEIVPIRVAGDDGTLPGHWLALASDVPMLEAAERNGFEGRTVLLSPFDNLICDRARTEQLFGFEYRIEIYVPVAKRRYGYYVLPILHGDRLIGRVDSRFDKAQNVYEVHNIYAEADAPRDKTTGKAVRAAVDSMAEWLGAEHIRFGRAEAWASSLR